MARTYRLYRFEPNVKKYRVMKFIKYDEGARLVRGKWAAEIADNAGNTVAFELLAFPGAKPRQSILDFIRGGGPRAGTCTAFSRAEVDAIAGLRGRSQTLGMTEEQKKVRALRDGVPAEDFVERALQKARHYLSTH